jgi:hypothetical protein
MHLKKQALIGGVAALASTAAILASTMAPANADPTRPYAATGSDTTQDVWNGLTNDFGAPITSIANWDAFVVHPPVATQANSYIKTKTGGNWFLRPAGSGNGVRSLGAVWDPAFVSHLWPAGTGDLMNHEDVDMARSSGGPTTGTGLKYIPFARDAVSIAFNPATGLTSVNLTTAEITSLYNGVDAPSDQVTFSAQPATASTVVSVNGVPVQPKIPQAGSGTRNFFQSAVGVPDGSLAPYINTATPLPENDGSVLPNDGDLIPFSAAQWISQANGKVTDTRSTLALASINGAAPTTGSAPTMEPGPLFGGTNLSGDFNVIPGSGVGVFNRDTYDVVPALFLAGTSKQQALVSILGSSAGVYGSGSKTVIKSFGFGTLSYGTQTANWRDGLWLH